MESSDAEPLNQTLSTGASSKSDQQTKEDKAKHVKAQLDPDVYPVIIKYLDLRTIILKMLVLN